MAKEKVLNKAGVEILKEEVEKKIPTSLPASDVYSWAKAKTKPTYTAAEIGLGNVENKSSATIRGELTKADITTALGYTPPTQDTNTHYTSKNVVGSATSTTNTTTALTNGNVYLNSVENNAVTSSHKISGGGATKVTTDESGNIVITSTDTNTTYSAATTSANGLMTSAMVTKLNGIATGANAYTLPTASSSTLGGVKTTSTVTSTSGLTACPIIGGVPYYKDTNTTYTLSSLGVTATAAELNTLDGITATVSELNYCDGVTSNIQTQLNNKAAASHTHNYAGSSSAGGVATSAAKLSNTAAIGSATKPVYFNASGVPVAGTYTLGEACSKSLTNVTAKGALGWTNTIGTTLPTLNTLAFWNGAYTDTKSNLTYCNKGAFGDIVTESKGTYIKDLSVSGKTITYTKGDDTTGTITTQDTNTTYSAATSSALGLVKIGSNITNSSGTISLTKANVTSALGYTPPTTNTTYSTFVKSGSGAAAGLVPAPSTTAGTSKYLREDGTWTTPPNTNTTYSVVTASANGLVPMFDAADGTIDSSSTDWVLTNNNGSIGWYKLPANAFNNTTYTSLKNPNALTVKGNGTQSFTYDGSSAKTLNIKAGTGVSVSSDTSGNVTIATNGEGDAASLSGLSAEEIASNENLLDNSSFSYNQRGKTLYSGTGYTVDRWKIAPNTASGAVGSLAVGDNYWVKLTTTSSNSICLSQVVETKIPEGTEVTLSVNVEDVSGTWEMLQMENTSKVLEIKDKGWQSITLKWEDCSNATNAGHGSFAIRSTGAGYITISAAKLEYGSLRTKFIKQKGLDTTLQCQRYYSKIDLGTPISSCWGTGTKTLRLSFYAPAIMNSKPSSEIETVVSSGYSWLMKVYSADGTQVYETTSVPTITTNKKNGAIINVTLTFNDGTPKFSGHQNYMVGLGDGCAFYFVLSADYA